MEKMCAAEEWKALHSKFRDAIDNVHLGLGLDFQIKWELFKEFSFFFGLVVEIDSCMYQWTWRHSRTLVFDKFNLCHRIEVGSRNADSKIGRSNDFVCVWINCKYVVAVPLDFVLVVTVRSAECVNEKGIFITKLRMSHQAWHNRIIDRLWGVRGCVVCNWIFQSMQMVIYWSITVDTPVTVFKTLENIF